MADLDLRDRSVLSYRCAVTPDALWLLRQLLSQWFTDQRVAPEDVDDLVVIANELCTSVVVLGHDDEIAVRAQLRDGEARVEVAEHDPVTPPTPDEMVLSSALGDEVVVRSTHHLTRIACRRRVRMVG